MRPLEILLSCANILTLVTLVVPRLRASPWMRHAAPVTVLIAVEQATIEGWRWQLVPAYALTALFFLIWLLQGGAAAAHPASRDRPAGLGIWLAAVLGGLTLACATLLPLLVPVFHFPPPTGRYAIGTLTYDWVDTSRAEIFVAPPDARRELMVQLWYPAMNDPSAPRAPYVEHPEVLTLLAKLFGLPGFVFGHLRYVSTAAVAGAPPAAGGPWPVLIFAHGRGGFRQHNTVQIQDLVSHGYVVAAMDQPGVASGVVFDSGRLAPFDPRMFNLANPGHPPFLDSVIPFLARDASFTLDRLDSLNQADPQGILTGQLDLQHAGMFGVSLGGATTAEACRIETRLRACLMMDVFMPRDVVRDGLRQPAMWISREAGSMRLEGWAERDIDETQTTMRRVFNNLPGDGYLVLVPGTFHADFSDFPFFSPLTRRLGLTGPINPQRAHAIIDRYSLAFFERHLKGVPQPMLYPPADSFPEVKIMARRPFSLPQ